MYIGAGPGWLVVREGQAAAARYSSGEYEHEKLMGEVEGSDMEANDVGLRLGGGPPGDE